MDRNYNTSGGFWRRGSSANRGPPPAGPRSVPSWERHFCEFASVPWPKLLEAKKFMDVYPHIMKWNDAAAEEAFNNAKNRFYARINGLPCDFNLPDPDIYIDKVDWEARIDPELLLDWEREHEWNKTRAESQVTNLAEPSVLENPPVIRSYGWEDPEEEPPIGGAKSQGLINGNETNNEFPCGDSKYDTSNTASGKTRPWNGGASWRESNKCSNYNKYGGRGGKWNNSNGVKNSNNLARPPGATNNYWRRKDGCGDNEGRYWCQDTKRQNRGCNNGWGRERQEQYRWVDRRQLDGYSGQC